MHTIPDSYNYLHCLSVYIMHICLTHRSRGIDLISPFCIYLMALRLKMYATYTYLKVQILHSFPFGIYTYLKALV